LILRHQLEMKAQQQQQQKLLQQQLQSSREEQRERMQRGEYGDNHEWPLVERTPAVPKQGTQGQAIGFGRCCWLYYNFHRCCCCC
jgi:hypothetical protein